MNSTDDRIEAAVDAAAGRLHELCRERRQPRWENASMRWRDQLKTFVRPLVVAALDAASERTVADSASEFESGHDARF